MFYQNVPDFGEIITSIIEDKVYITCSIRLVYKYWENRLILVTKLISHPDANIIIRLTDESRSVYISVWSLPLLSNQCERKRKWHRVTNQVSQKH